MQLNQAPAWHGSLGRLLDDHAYRLPGNPMSSAAQVVHCAFLPAPQALTEPDSSAMSPSLPTQVPDFAPAHVDHITC